MERCSPIEMSVHVIGITCIDDGWTGPYRGVQGNRETLMKSASQGRWPTGLVLAALLGTGCAHAKRLSEEAGPVCPTAAATVYVANDNWLDMNILIQRGGSRYRLGNVSSLSTAVFEVPPGV